MHSFVNTSRVGRKGRFNFRSVFIVGVSCCQTLPCYENPAGTRILAAECHSTARQIDTLWFQRISLAGNDTDYKTEAKQLLEIQDTKLADILTIATKIGINLTFQIKTELILDNISNSDDSSPHLYNA